MTHAPPRPHAKKSSATGWYVGFGISAGLVLVLIVGVLLYVFWGSGLPGPTAATTEGGRLEKITFDPDLSVLISPGGTGGGAEATYDSAIAVILQENGSNFKEDLKRVREPEKSREHQPLLEALVKAADQGLAGESLRLPSVKITPVTEFATEDGLIALGQIGVAAARSQWADGKKAEGDASFRGALVYGHRLWKHGTHVTHKKAGLAVMNEAFAQAISHYKGQDETRLKAAQTLADQARQVSLQWTDKERMVAPRKLPGHTGDLANMAENDKDRAWRIEGLLWLGHAKWAKGSGERAAVDAFLEDHASDSDPLIAEAARTARAFTVQDFRDATTN